ncbi:MAG: alpha/beta hydrolase [Alphaproteobacteria bacterium]
MVEPRSIFISATDGLQLHVRLWGENRRGHLPLLCLPGLSRNTADFEVLAQDMAAERLVVAVDYRGRGLSAWDPVWTNYSLPVELGDLTSVATAIGLAHAIFLGTSRGGIHTLLMAASRPGMVKGAILNDIGPEVDPTGLARIKSYLGKLPEPASMAAAVALLKSVAAAKFPAFSAADWERQAAAMWVMRDGKLIRSYDPALVKTLEGLDFDAPIPTLWPQFDGLAKVPMLSIRGELSDILPVEVVQKMSARRPDLEVFTVPGQGHAPALTDQPSIGRIAAFCRHCDGLHH